MNQKKTSSMVMTGLFMAIVILMAFVPNLGYINLIVIKATLIHVPVIIGAIVLGPKKGAILGLTFGITSLINNTMNPSLLSFAFSPFYSIGEIGGNAWSIVIALVPRILAGIVPYYLFTGLQAVFHHSRGKRILSLTAACAAGSLCNTLLVMNLIYFCFRDEFAAAKNIAVDAVYGAILSIIAVNGIPEAIVAAVLGTAVCTALLRLMPAVTLPKPAKGKESHANQ